MNRWRCVYRLQPQNPPPAAGAGVAAGVGAGLAGLTGSVDAPVSRPNTPIAADAAAPAAVGASAAGAAATRPCALRKLSSFCFISSASCLAIASAVLACTSSKSSASCWSSVGGGGAGTGGVTVGTVESCALISDEDRLLKIDPAWDGVDLLLPSFSSLKPVPLAELFLSGPSLSW